MAVHGQKDERSGRAERVAGFDARKPRRERERSGDFDVGAIGPRRRIAPDVGKVVRAAGRRQVKTAIEEAVVHLG